MSVAEMLKPWQGQELVPLPDLARSVGLDRNAQHYAMRHGMFTPATKRGRNGRYLITWDDAILIVTAAIVAAAAGIAIVTALHALRGAGAQVSGDVVTIPLGVAA
jgi:hypothetical protein